MVAPVPRVQLADRPPLGVARPRGAILRAARTALALPLRARSTLHGAEFAVSNSTPLSFRFPVSGSIAALVARGGGVRGSHDRETAAAVESETRSRWQQRTENSSDGRNDERAAAKLRKLYRKLRWLRRDRS